MPYALIPLLALVAFEPPEGEVGQGPQPAANPISWELEFKFLDPQRIEVQLPGRTEPEVYWYIVYTATNTSGRTQDFFPMFQIVTEDLQVFGTDLGIHQLVFDAIRERHRLTHKYLVHPTKAIGPLLAGTDHARESVAIWRDIDLNVNQFMVYVAGLSGELQFLRNPSYDSDEPEVAAADPAELGQVENPKHFTLRKTLSIRYTLPGSAPARHVASPRRESVDWIMR